MYHKSADEKQQLMELFSNIYDDPMWSLGVVTKKAEQMCKSTVFKGDKNTLLVNDGTHAIELCLRDINVKGKHVLVPALTVPMVEWAVKRAGGIPIKVDVDVHQLQMTVKGLEEAYNSVDDVGAVIIVHTGGLITPDIFDVVTFCTLRSLPLVEDISHAQCSYLDDGKDKYYAGTFGQYAAFSMYATKVVSAGEGGFAAKRGEITGMKALRNQGKTDQQKFVREGYNFRASEWTAAVAYVKLVNLGLEIGHRSAIADIYDQAGVRPLHKSTAYEEKGYEMYPSFYKYIIPNFGGGLEGRRLRNVPHPSGAVHRDLDDYQNSSANLAAWNHICLSLANEEHALANISHLQKVGLLKGDDTID